MSKISITLELDPEYADDAHSTGVTEAGHDMIYDLLGEMGSNIEITRARES